MGRAVLEAAHGPEAAVSGGWRIVSARGRPGWLWAATVGVGSVFSVPLARGLGVSLLGFPHFRVLFEHHRQSAWFGELLVPPQRFPLGTCSFLFRSVGTGTAQRGASRAPAPPLAPSHPGADPGEAWAFSWGKRQGSPWCNMGPGEVFGFPSSPWKGPGAPVACAARPGAPAAGAGRSWSREVHAGRTSWRMKRPHVVAGVT